jgi:4-methyl-5(b-hydroxyethyl)-thiazole monophosphate biosynthesis
MKGLLVLSNNIEDGEALFTLALLRRIGLSVDTVTFQHDHQIKTAFGLEVRVDYLHHEIDFDHYQFIIIPGGRYVSQIISEDTQIKQAVKTFNDQFKLVAAICAGPRFLGQAGILDHKKFTCYPGSEVDMPKGIYIDNLKVVIDTNIITAKSAGAIYEFAHAITHYLLGEQKAQNLYDSIYY